MRRSLSPFSTRLRAWGAEAVRRRPVEGEARANPFKPLSASALRSDVALAAPRKSPRAPRSTETRGRYSAYGRKRIRVPYTSFLASGGGGKGGHTRRQGLVGSWKSPDGVPSSRRSAETAPFDVPIAGGGHGKRWGKSFTC